MENVQTVTTSKTSDDWNEMNIDDLIESDARFKSIFTRALVVSRGMDNHEELITENPVAYVNNLEKTFDDLRATFDSANVREDFIQNTLEKPETLVSFEAKVIAKMDLEILKSIPPESVRSVKSISIDGVSMSIPMILDINVPTYTQQFTVVNQLLIDQIVSDHMMLGHRVDKTATLNAIQTRMRQHTLNFSKVEARRHLAMLMATALTLSSIQRGLVKSVKNWLTIDSPLYDESTGGMFVHTNPSVLPPDIDYKSMIEPCSIGVDLKTTYNFNHHQIKTLITWLFSNNNTEKLKAKISLLSTTHGIIRDDLALYPTKVLLQSFKEYFLTREEVVDLMFNSVEDNNSTSRRCPACKTAVTTPFGGLLVHRECTVIKWIVKHFGCEYQDGSLTIPKYSYVSPGIASYARKAYKIKHRNMTDPIVGNDPTFVAYVMDDRGKPVLQNPPAPHV